MSRISRMSIKTMAIIMAIIVLAAGLATSIILNLGQRQQIQTLQAEIDSLREPMIHLVHYEWQDVDLGNNQHQITIFCILFNSGERAASSVTYGFWVFDQNNDDIVWDEGGGTIFIFPAKSKQIVGTTISYRIYGSRYPDSIGISCSHFDDEWYLK